MKPISTTLLSSLPKLEDLCYISCLFSNIQMNHKILKQIRHCQIVFCRYIIKHFSETIASPVPGTENYIYVIVSKEFYETKKLQEYLQINLIHYSDPQAVNFEILKICMKYSIICRLLPVWNELGEYLYEKNNSPERPGELNAIKFDLDIKEQKMLLKLDPLKLKVFSLISEPTLEKFQNSSNVSLDLRNQIEAFIIPGLEQCKLLRVTKEIPSTCQFENYNVVRDHWENMCGIVMPKKPEGIDYYEVSLLGFDNRIFVYPGICLQAALPKIVKCDNQAEIVHHFLEDLKVKVRKICGEKLFFEYHSSETETHFFKPKEVQREINFTPSKSSIVKIPPFNIGSKNFSSNTIFDSPTISCGSNSGSFSFQNIEESRTSSKNEFVKHWLLNACASPSSSTETESMQSRYEFKHLSDSPFNKIKKFSTVTEAPSIRSIESVKISLLDLKQGKIKEEIESPKK